MHKIQIPESARQVAMGRRGSLRKYGRLAPQRTALLVIDMQNGFLLPGMPIELPHGRDIVPNINRLAGGVRDAGGLVVWIQANFQKERQSWSNWFDHHMKAEVREQMIASLTPGNPGFDIHAGLDARKSDLFVQKTRFSAFVHGASHLDQILRARDIDTVIITGTLSNTCCESTARDAMQLNYQTVFVSDGNAARTDEEHNAVLVNMLQTFADVLSTDEVISALRAEEKSAAGSLSG